MPQIKDLDDEKTLPIDGDYVALDDSADSWKSKKVKASSFWAYIIGKFSASKAEIDNVCDGNTATAAEISQICKGREAGGDGIADIVINKAFQELQQKILTLPYLNDAITEVTISGLQANTLANTTGSGRVNEVQQGLAIGNTTITAPGSHIKHGLVNINLPSSDSLSFGPVSSFNPSEIVMIRNISATTTATINRLSADRFWYDGVGYVTITLTAGNAIALMAVGSDRWMVLGKTDVTLS